MMQRRLLGTYGEERSGWRLAVTQALGALGLLSSTAQAATKITIEAVDAYSCGPLGGNIANVDNFRSRMTSVTGYTSGLRYTNSTVYDTDFRDPQKISGGADTSNSTIDLGFERQDGTRFRVIGQVNLPQILL
jgi:hypothetical protein